MILPYSCTYVYVHNMISLLASFVTTFHSVHLLEISYKLRA